MGLNATVRKLLTRNPGSSAVDVARVRNAAQVSPTDVANSITSVQRQIDAVVTVALADQTVSDPITVSGEDGGQIGWIGTVVQNAVSYLGMWFKNFWLGGTSPATAQIYSDSLGDVFIDGAEIVNTPFELNLNGVTTSIENLNSAVGVLSIKSLDNTTSYYSGATPTGFELLDNLGNSLGSLRSSGASGHLDLSNVAGTNTVNLITGGGGAPKLSIASAAGTVSMSPGIPFSVFGNTVVDSSRNGSFASVTASTGDVNITSGLLALNGTTRITNAGNAAFTQVALDLKVTPVTGTSGGVGVGNAIISSTTAGLFLSLNGAAPVAIAAGTTLPAGLTTQVQYNDAGIFGASANFAWNNAANVLTVGPANTAGTGYAGTIFNSSATAATVAFQTATGTFSITGAGDASFQQMAVALKASAVTGTSGGTGVGNALLSATTAGLFLSLNGASPISLGTGAGTVTSVALTAPSQFTVTGTPVTSAGTLAIAWNTQTANTVLAGPTSGGAAAPTYRALVAADIAGLVTPGGSNTQVQFNNSGAFGGSANLVWDGTTLTANALIASNGLTVSSGGVTVTVGNVLFGTTLLWNNATSILTLTGGVATGIVAPLFSSTNTGTDNAFQTSTGTFSITGAGDAAFQQVALALKVAAVTGTSGGTGVGNAMLSATTAGLFLSLNGATPVSLGAGTGTVTSVALTAPSQFAVTGSPVTSAGTLALAWNNQTANTILAGPASGGAAAPTYRALVAADIAGLVTPGGSNTQVQFNNAGVFSGAAGLVWDGTTLTANAIVGSNGLTVSAGGITVTAGNVLFGTTLLWNNTTSILTLTGGVATGIIAPLFSSTNTGTDNAFQTSTGTFSITGAGNAAFQQVALALKASAVTGISGGTGVGNAMLSATTAGLFLSLNGATPVALGSGTVTSVALTAPSQFAVTGSPITGAGTLAIAWNTQTANTILAGPASGGAAAPTYRALVAADIAGLVTPAGATTQVQYNNAGAFAGAANFAWDNAANILTVGPANTAGTGYVGTLFNSSATGTPSAFQTSTGTFSITGAGNAAFQGLTLTNRLSSAYYAPAGSNQQIQFNNSGAPGASASLTWNGITLTSLAMSTSALLVTSSGIGVTGASSITSASAAQTLDVGNTGGGNAIRATAGILVTAGGLSVSAGGLSITAGGFSVVGGIVANGNTGFTGTLAAAIAAGRNVQYGIIY